MKWQMLSQEVPQDLKQLKVLLLKTRDIKNPDSFFNLKSPFDLSLAELDFDKKQTRKAIKLILEAKEKKQNILIFGDYDADGICATAIMWQSLHDLGLQVLPFIPHREKHGYGLSNKAIDEILAGDNKPDLVITVDNGIVAHNEVSRLINAGIKVIVTDHHQPESELPAADAIVHSVKLCGATVAWILTRELVKICHSEFISESPDQQDKILKQVQDDMQSHLDLCGIATIADQVKLKDANRIFAKAGIKALRQSQRPGLLELFKEANIIQKDIDTYHVNYVIAPRINAMGRLEHGLDALRLLVSKSKTTAKNLAQKLSNVNRQRQDITQIALESASSNFQQWQNEKLIIVSSNDYHEGVIGLIAGKLVDQFYKPAIAISLSDDTLKASARSISGFNITDLLRQIKDDLLSVGGHPMAAGFSANIKNLDLISEKLKKLTKEQLDNNLLERSLKIALELPLGLLSEELVAVVDEFAPFGPGNRKPIFLLKNLQVIDFKTIGRENNHLLLNLKSENKYLKALAWGMGSRISELNSGDLINIAGLIEINEYNGRRSIQLVVRDFKTSV